jgi:hypothetical protein
MNPELSSLVQASLAGNDPASEALHEACQDAPTARLVREHLLRLPRETPTVSDWINMIDEMHPELARESSP